MHLRLREEDCRPCGSPEKRAVLKLGCRQELIQKRLAFTDGTCMVMLANRMLRRNNSSGCRGVNGESSRGGWRASICVQGKRKILGRFVRYEDAVKARREAEEQLHEVFLRVWSKRASPRHGRLGTGERPIRCGRMGLKKNKREDSDGKEAGPDLPAVWNDDHTGGEQGMCSSGVPVRLSRRDLQYLRTFESGHAGNCGRRMFPILWRLQTDITLWRYRRARNAGDNIIGTTGVYWQGVAGGLRVSGFFHSRQRIMGQHV